VILADLEDLADEGVVERCGRLRLAAEAFAGLSVGGKVRGQNLDGHLAAKLRVFGTKNLTHSARTNRRKNLILADSRTWGDRHTRCGSSLPDELQRMRREHFAFPEALTAVVLSSERSAIQA
jgi:hypothetical protein